MAAAGKIGAASVAQYKAVAHAKPIKIQKSLNNFLRIGLSALAQLHAWLDQYHARPALPAASI